MATILTEEQRVPLTAEFKTATDKLAQVDSFAWSSSNPEVITMQELTSEDRTRLNISPDTVARFAVATGQIGTAQAQLTADADLGEGVREITGLHDLEVRAGEATQVLIAAGAPEPKV